MADLKEIRLNNVFDIKSTKLFAQNLINVERIHITSFAFLYVLPFVRYSAKVKVINYVGNHGTHSVDVVALNKIRANLNNACKLTIYVHEDIYLVTKWKSLPTKCSLFELKRIGAYEFDKPIF